MLSRDIYLDCRCVDPFCHSKATIRDHLSACYVADFATDGGEGLIPKAGNPRLPIRAASGILF
jgi:hypothetical protein